MTQGPTIIGEARNCVELVDVYRDRKNALGLTDATVDYLSGLQSGYTGKLLGPAQVKGLGPMAIQLFNQVLAVKFLIVVDEEMTAKMRSRWDGRERPLPVVQVRASTAAIERFRPIIARDMQQRGREKISAGMKAKMSPAKRRAIAKRAARARWSRKKAERAARRNAPADEERAA